MQAAQTPASKLRFVTPDKESSMSTLWQEEEFEQICSKELLTEKAADIEKTIAVKEHEKERYAFDPTMFYEKSFWNRRPDGWCLSVFEKGEPRWKNRVLDCCFYFARALSLFRARDLHATTLTLFFFHPPAFSSPLFYLLGPSFVLSWDRTLWLSKMAT